MMDGISGASAVVALGCFVATTIRELNKLQRDIRIAPKELLGLLSYLEQLEIILNNASRLIDRPKSSAHRSDSLDSIEKATEHCAENLKTLELLVNKIKGPPRKPNPQAYSASLFRILNPSQDQESTPSHPSTSTSAHQTTRTNPSRGPHSQRTRE